MSLTANMEEKFKPAMRVAGQNQDVWTMIREASAASPFKRKDASGNEVSDVVNMGQGFYGYNPPDFVLDAAKEALNHVDCNQYSHTKGRIRLREAIAKAYSPLMGQKIDPNTEVVVTTGANEGVLCAFMGFIEEGDEVILFEPYFDQYISNIEMAGGKVRYVPLQPPERGAIETCPASEWTVDMGLLEKAINKKTKMIVLNSPHNPVGKVFSKEELIAIGDLCEKHNIIIISDEVYDRLYYTPFTRIATLSQALAARTLTVGSAGKNFYCTGWRVGWLLGPEYLVKYVAAAHTRICFCGVSPLQEAAAVAFEKAEEENFWNKSREDMQSKVQRFGAGLTELGIPYTIPSGGYFILANFRRLRLPTDYVFPPHVLSRPRDFKLAWFLIMEMGVAAIPPTEFYTKPNAHMAEDYLRFAVCQTDEMLEKAKERLRGLRKYLD